MGMSNLDGYHPNKNESYQLGYQQGRTDEREKGLDEVSETAQQILDEACILFKQLEDPVSFHDGLMAFIISLLNKLQIKEQHEQ